VKLRSVRIEGFGKLVDRTIDFDPAFNVVYGRNEAGKTTLSAALVATLFGFGRGEKDQWRPWSGARYATALTYELADGRTFEVHRDFERDTRGVRVFDQNGADASSETSVGKTVNPGHAHLGIPLEVFVNASFAAQGDVAIDGARAERITHALARALDGGPKEDAALGALKRLDDALALHVGKKKATVNAPLRNLRDEIEEAQQRVDDARAHLRALDDVRARLAHETTRASDFEAALRDSERRGRALRVHTLRSRLDALSDVRDDLAALQGERELYDDVDNFPSAKVSELEARYREWHTLDALARAHGEEAARAHLGPALLAELDERAADGGALAAAQVGELEAAAAATTEARDKATYAADRAQSARRSVEGGSELFGAAFASGGFVAIGAIVLAIFHDWLLAGIVACLAGLLFVFAWSRWSRRQTALRTISSMQREADEASASERDAAARVAAVLEPLGIPSIDEFARRRARAIELADRKAESVRLSARANETRARLDGAARAFDRLAAQLVSPSGSRERDLARAKAREARKSARDGIDLRLSMLDVRRTDVLGTDDEFAVERELAELLAAGVEAAPPGGASPRAFEAERADLERRASESRANVAAAAAELRISEAQVADLAVLDERVATLRARAEKLERFEAAVSLARRTIDERTKEAHQKFARRLADYASDTFANVTADRYLDLRVDPTTLELRVRVPETGAIESVDRLSMGTREQAYLVVRLAMVRMFSEGLETAPLLFDDPFAFWDEERIERSFPLLSATATGVQVVLFTTSSELAHAAKARGARIHELSRS
jgi:DNA repair exonuclease SbcCD ATPase subunit